MLEWMADRPLGDEGLDELHQELADFVECKVEGEHQSPVVVGVAMLSVGAMVLSKCLGKDEAASFIDTLRCQLLLRRDGEPYPN